LELCSQSWRSKGLCKANIQNNLRSTYGVWTLYTKNTLLLIDEGQFLNQHNRKTGKTGEALEWTRGLAETWGQQIAFCGDLTLASAIATMPQLQSRMRRPVIIGRVNPNDVAALIEGTGFKTAEITYLLTALAALKGELRNVENVVRLAGLFAGSDAPTFAHVKAATIDMKLMPKGGLK
jgi:hypothetical protein